VYSCENDSRLPATRSADPRPGSPRASRRRPRRRRRRDSHVPQRTRRWSAALTLESPPIPSLCSIPHSIHSLSLSLSLSFFLSLSLVLWQFSLRVRACRREGGPRDTRSLLVLVVASKCVWYEGVKECGDSTDNTDRVKASIRMLETGRIRSVESGRVESPNRCGDFYSGHEEADFGRDRVEGFGWAGITRRASWRRG